MKLSPKQVARELDKFRMELPYLVGTVIVEFALDNWDKQGWQGQSFKPWQDTKPAKGGRSILVGKQSGRLRRSVKFKTRGGGKVEGGSDLEYAGIHNEGGKLKVKVTAKSRKFFWAMWYETKEEKWKWMALTKKTYMIINMPERRFIGDSPVLDKMILEMIEKRLKRILS